MFYTIIDLIVCRDGSVSSEDVMELLRPYCSVIVKPRLDVLHNNRSDCLKGPFCIIRGRDGVTAAILLRLS